MQELEINYLKKVNQYMTKYAKKLEVENRFLKKEADKAESAKTEVKQLKKENQILKEQVNQSTLAKNTAEYQTQKYKGRLESLAKRTWTLGGQITTLKNKLKAVKNLNEDEDLNEDEKVCNPRSQKGERVGKTKDLENKGETTTPETSSSSVRFLPNRLSVLSSGRRDSRLHDGAAERTEETGWYPIASSLLMSCVKKMVGGVKYVVESSSPRFLQNRSSPLFNGRLDSCSDEIAAERGEETSLPENESDDDINDQERREK